MIYSLGAIFYNSAYLKRKHLLFIPILIAAILTQIIAEVLVASKIKHYFLFHLYVPLEYILLSTYYYYLFNRFYLKGLIIISNLFLLTFYFFHYWGAKFYEPDYSGFNIEMIFISVLVVLFFALLLKKEEDIVLSKNPDFWINTGNLFFYTGCVFVMGLHYTLRQKNVSLAEKLLIINHFLNLVLYLFYAIAFTCLRLIRK